MNLPHTRKVPPGPREIPLLGSSLAVVKEPLEFLTRISKEYGDVVRFGLPGQDVYLFNHPDAIEEVLLTKHEAVIKDAFTRKISLVVGNGLLVSDGPFWRRQRKLAQPAFHHKRVNEYAEVMVRYTEELADRFRGGEVRNVHRDMMRLTLAIVARTLFGVQVDHLAAEIEEALEVLVERFVGVNAIVPMYLPTPANIRARRAMRKLDSVVYGIIEQRRNTADTGDLLSMLLTARAEDGTAMSDEQVRDESITLLLAGHETTALTLSFALHLLGRHPDVDAALAREISEVLGDRPCTPADLPRLKIAEGVIRESMRLYPPAWAIGREVVAPVEIAGYDLRPGTQIWAAQWVVHRDPRYFDRPEQFDPSRWCGDLAKRLPRFAYFPFGGGPRFCIGNTFAMMEATLILVTLLRRFRLSPTTTERLKLNPAVTLRPEGGVNLSVGVRAAGKN
ncbi:MAG TPA: cytochrome P450 [Polyangiaceae bacterium]